MKVSLYKSQFDTYKIKNVDLLQFLTTIQFKDIVLKLRETKDVEQQKKIKALLPSVTVSATFKEFRRKTHLDKHSGFLCIDIDQFNDDQTPESIKQICSSFNETWYCGYSCRGKVFAIIKIDPQQHLNSFLSLEIILKQQFNIVVDRGCKDITRLRKASFDDHYYHNPNAQVYRVPNWLFEMEKEKIQRQTSKQVSFHSKEEATNHWLKLIEKYQYDFTQGNGWNWLTHKVFDAIAKGIDQKTVENTILQLSDSKQSDRWIKYHINHLYKTN